MTQDQALRLLAAIRSNDYAAIANETAPGNGAADVKHHLEDTTP